MKKGKLSFSTRLLEKDEEEIAEVLSQIKFMPYRVEHMLVTRSLEMIGTSFRFDDIGDGEIPPEYALEITRSDDGDIAVTGVVKKKI